jgi:hypothetical protein
MQDSGDHPRAFRCHEPSLEIARNIGDHRLESDALFGVGLAYFLQGAYERAIEF